MQHPEPLLMAPLSSDALSKVERALISIGYGGDLLQRNYKFSDSHSSGQLPSIPLASFAQTPPSYRNACMGVIHSNGISGARNVAQYQYLGAPIIFEISANSVHQWKVTAVGAPQHIDNFLLNEIENAFDSHQSQWNPRQVFEAKTSGQLDFIDAGLMPILAGMIQTKLDQLLRHTRTHIAEAYKAATNTKAADQDLFRFMFRFIAAKVLRDREHPGGWQSDDAGHVVRAINEYYNVGANGLPVSTIEIPSVIEVAWQEIVSSFHFQNLSVDDLAFVYENTFITPQTRKTFGTHSTPPHIAEYIVQKLPINEIDFNTRRVLEPCSGHGIFLVSAMRRLRELLPNDFDNRQRHEYLRQRLVGLEVDAFAREVSNLCLMLADYPNPDGWQIYDDDVFSSRRLEQELPKTDVVLCNPPFGSFSLEERQRYAGNFTRPQKPVEILERILASPPTQLGFVLPKSFLFGAAYRATQRQLTEWFDDIEIVVLPDNVFNHADQETALLIASGKRQRNITATVTCRIMDKQTHEVFRKEGKAPVPISTTNVTVSNTLSLWNSELAELWNYLSSAPTLSSLVKIRRGIEWKPRISPQKIISSQPVEGWLKGLNTTKNSFEQYCVFSVVSINPDPQNMREVATPYQWDKPKVLLNAHASSRQRWRLKAVTDYSGLLVTQAFHVAFPKATQVSVEVVAALINSPLANAWIFDRADKRDNQARAYDSIPTPALDRIDQFLVGNKVKKLEELLQPTSLSNSEKESVKRLLMEIDALILAAYNLPRQLEEQLLTAFEGMARPVPVAFDGYGEAYETAKTSVSSELHQAQTTDRYQELVDQLFIRGLNADETQEMESLGQEIDRYSEPFYDNLFQHLQQETS